MLDIVVDKKQVYKYLGYTKNMQLNDNIVKQIDNCILTVLNSVSPRTTYSVKYDIIRDNGLKIQGMQLIGSDIYKHLMYSDKVILMAVTLGNQADLLIRRAELLDMTSAVIYDAICSVLADQVADRLESEIRKQVESEGLYLTGRYSPGYGDMPLESERDLLALLDAERRVGITLTDTNLMVPRKSITAVLGVGKVQFTGRKADCEHCLLKGKCEFRKRGTTCNE